MKHVSTLSYTLSERKDQKEERSADRGMDMLKDHGGENAGDGEMAKRSI